MMKPSMETAGRKPCGADAPMDLILRDALPADAQAIAALVCGMAEGDKEYSPITADFAVEYLASPGCGILIAEMAGRPAGLLSYSIRPGLFHAAPSCLIELLWVRPDVRGRGTGSALIGALLERAAALGCAEVSVSTMPGNAGAIRFYRRHGLTEEAVFLERHFPAETGKPVPEN
jgi:ribosomal protein S18 acetylase RimI-like enzyme